MGRQAPMDSTFAIGVSACAAKTCDTQHPSASTTAGSALECFNIE